jgi:cytochrome c oxidase assembly protein subunit 15
VTSFARFAWGVLAYNLVVVMWGAYVRATGSGAGCGSHWPLCNGAVVPASPQAATIIEFTHRLSSGLALLAVVAVAIWAFRVFPRAHPVRKAGVASVVLILVEALLGAGLVLFRYVADNASVGRAIYLSAHLVNTMLLLGAITVTAWFATTGVRWPGIRFGGPLAIAFGLSLLLGVSGAVTALGDTLYPPSTLQQGIQQDFAPAAHFLIRLRVLHPVIAVITCAYLAVLAWVAARRFGVRANAQALGVLMAVQLAAGVVNVLLLAPVWMQMVHLVLGDLMWIALVLLSAEVAVASPQHEPRFRGAVLTPLA